MPISREKSQVIWEMSKTLSKEEIAKRLDVEVRSVARYLRRHKELTVPKNFKAKVLLVDIETLFGVGRYWRVWKENINTWQIIHPVCLLSWSAKWLFEPGIFGDIMTPEEALARNPERIVKTLWNTMEEAHIVIWHNGRAFDELRINTEFLLLGKGRPSSYRSIDTCLVARKMFGFEHNTLAELAMRLGVQSKTEVDNSLWVRCAAGDKKALKEMLDYNKQDVLVLEDVYDKLKPWIKDHPNLALFHSVEEAGGPMCRTCSSTDIQIIGDYVTSVNVYESYRCNTCGAIMRSRKAKTSLKKDTHILQAIS